jgi:hypothetical protein
MRYGSSDPQGDHMSEIYISVDVETDGPIPGPNSMLSLGAAAYKRVGVGKAKGTDFELIGTFSANLVELQGATPDPDTAKWWEGQPEAWAACRENPRDPTFAMQDFAKWVNAFGIKPVFVGYPAGFDFLFVYWYLIKFTGTSPFSFSALDIKSYAMAVMSIDYRDVTKRSMKPYLPADKPHTHVAVEDAVEQGELFCNLYRANALRGK